MDPRWSQDGRRWALRRALRELYHVITQPQSRRYLDTVLGRAGALAPPPPLLFALGGLSRALFVLVVTCVFKITDFGALLGCLGPLLGCL